MTDIGLLAMYMAHVTSCTDITPAIVQFVHTMFQEIALVSSPVSDIFDNSF
jgi:hypothetical protein